MSTDVDPIYADSLDALALAVADARPDWTDVVARAYPRQVRKVLSIAAIAAAALITAVAVAGPAFGLHLSSIVNFGNSSSAPAPVQHDFSEFDLGAPSELAPGAIASQTRLITTVQLSDGPHALYVSPTEQGGFCYVWTGGAGGCDQLGTTPVGIAWGLDRIVGTVASTYVSSVKITLGNGNVSEPDITWISAPINAGFFLFAIPPGQTVAEIDGYNAAGTLVSREARGPQPSESSSPPEFALTAHENVALAVSTPDGTATAYTAPSLTAGKCAWFELGGTDVRLYGYDGCMPHGYSPEGIAFRFVRIGDSVLFAGAASPRYARVTLRLPDGTTATIVPTGDGLILYSLPASLTSSTEPVTVTAYSADGQVIFTDPTTDATPTVPNPPATPTIPPSSAS